MRGSVRWWGQVQEKVSAQAQEMGQLKSVVAVQSFVAVPAEFVAGLAPVVAEGKPSSHSGNKQNQSNHNLELLLNRSSADFDRVVVVD